MHRETNLQVENEETIEAPSARTPKRCWTESNSAFSFACTDSLDGASARVTAIFRVCVRTASFRASPRSPFFRSSNSFADSAFAYLLSGLTRLACAKRVRYTQLSPTERSGKRSAVLLQAKCRRGSTVGWAARDDG